MAQKALDVGPPPWDASTLTGKRYAISDLVDDLRPPRSPLEAAAIIGALHEQLGDFYFRAQGLWSASKKQLPRRLAKTNPTFFDRWEEAFLLEAWRGRIKQVIELTEDILRPYGGSF